MRSVTDGFEVGLISGIRCGINMVSTGRGDPLRSRHLYQFHYKFGLATLLW